MKVHEKASGAVELLTKGDNNRVDDRGLYAPGQLWLERDDVLGRAVGTSAQIMSCTPSMRRPGLDGATVRSPAPHSLVDLRTGRHAALRRHGHYYPQRLPGAQVRARQYHGAVRTHEQGGGVSNK